MPLMVKCGVSRLGKFFCGVRHRIDAESSYNFFVRRRTPVLLVAVAVLISTTALADIPKQTAHSQPVLSANQSYLHLGALDDFSAPLDPHPFATEFYLHQFALENGKSSSHQRSWFDPVVSPVTNAASSLSKRVASLRRALVRLMP